MSTETRPIIVISQPMRGMSPEQVAEARKKAEKDVVSMGFKPYENVYDASFSDRTVPEGCKHPGILAMAGAMERLSQADALYLAPGWSSARGCRIEYEVALSFGMAIIQAETED